MNHRYSNADVSQYTFPNPGLTFLFASLLCQCHLLDALCLHKGPSNVHLNIINYLLNK